MTSSSSSSRTAQPQKEIPEPNGNLSTLPCQKDQIYIEKLERELQNCYQEIDYLQDQLNLRSSQSNFMGEHVHSLELKLSDLEKINKKMSLIQNDSQNLNLIKELKYKEDELKKLEMSYLDSQCEVESLKLELNEMEQRLFEFESENKKLESYKEDSSRRFFSQVELQLEKLLEKMGVNVGIEIDDSFLFELKKEFQFSDCLSNFEDSFDSVISKIAIISVYDQNMKDQIQESEDLIKQLKKELLEEKRKAKEDAEDLTQEMAELRYQSKEMLNEEYKRRALIEQASIKRIKQLEELSSKEQQKAMSAARRYHEAREISERQYLEIKKLKNALEKLHSDKAQRIDSCMCGFCAVSSEGSENDESSSQGLLEWRSDEN